MSRHPLDQRLANAGARREAVDAERSVVSANLRRLVREAVDADWSKTRIAQVAGISRQTVHEMLRD